jgi:hypothetical protein
MIWVDSDALVGLRLNSRLIDDLNTTSHVLICNMYDYHMRSMHIRIPQLTWSTTESVSIKKA